MLSARPIERMTIAASGLGLRGPGGRWLMRSVDFSPLPGSITIVEESIEGLGSVFLEALGGLRLPDAGSVSVGGRSWGDIGAAEANTIRGTINWSFKTPVWIETLSLADGITLEERYHTGRPGRDVADEAAELCRWFGLPGLPLSMPTNVSAGDLRRAELARAFLGDPIAVFLEQALGDAPGDVVACTMEAMERAARRGAAVVYAAPAGGEKRLDGLSAQRLRLTPEGMRVVGGEGDLVMGA